MADGESVEARAGRYWSQRAEQGEGDAVYWLDAPGVRESVNRRMTGDPAVPFAIAFAESLRARWPLATGLSIGCGTGELERFAVGGLGAVAEMDGVDVAGAALAIARERARAEGLEPRVRYHEADALTFLKGAASNGKRYELIVFHFVLHHLVELEAVVALAAELLSRDPPGLVYIDEYIGPSRDAWSEEELGFAAGLFARVPEEERRTPHVWPPLAVEDPSEMIRSGEIEPIVRGKLAVQRFVPYFGNVLHPLVCSIRKDAVFSGRSVEVIREAIQLEEYLISRDLLQPHFAAMVCGRLR
ncbi:MAG: class I SAM-dependent methyltransferase [Thermoanaerobaculia bacterium]|nr:class I SAM-dependent methyltransferase [Thermoanaerobaculia bacterium]